MSWINGKKTYIVAVATIAWAWFSVWSGAIGVDTAIGVTLGASGLGALRHGIANSSGT